MRRASAARMSSSALFTLATMWNRSRILRAWEHFSRITPKYGFHMSEQTNSIFADTSGPIMAKNSLKADRRQLDLPADDN